MLAKDYRTRCTLDAIVSDDWVTFEGSEPLFESVDFSGTSYGEFMGFASRDESAFEDTYYVMILDKSWVNRTMLSQKINNLHHAVCACYEKEDEVLEMMASARSYSVTSNFDYIFVEVRPENKGMETIREIRRLGFHGKIIAVNYGPQEAQEIVNADAADAQVKFPIPVRDVTKILSTDDFEDVQKLQRTNSHSGGVTLEDIDAAITAVGGEDELTTEGDISTRPSLRSSSIDEDAEADADAEAGPDAEVGA
jgi:CheY-like chemotaxis protein